jgi:hypothetical protein
MDPWANVFHIWTEHRASSIVAPQMNSRAPRTVTPLMTGNQSRQHTSSKETSLNLKHKGKKNASIVTSYFHNSYICIKITLITSL